MFSQLVFLSGGIHFFVQLLKVSKTLMDMVIIAIDVFMHWIEENDATFVTGSGETRTCQV